jgi:hypothetical protein
MLLLNALLGLFFFAEGIVDGIQSVHEKIVGWQHWWLVAFLVWTGARLILFALKNSPWAGSFGLTPDDGRTIRQRNRKKSLA